MISYKFRIYPSKQIERKLQFVLNNCKYLYNTQLMYKKQIYFLNKSYANKIELNNLIPDWRIINPKLKEIYAQVLQNVSDRLDKSFKSFFRRVKKGEKAGFPRFKSRNRYNSFTYPQLGFKLDKNKLILSKIGNIKIKLHRKINGKIKILTIKKTLTNKWFAIVTTDINKKIKGGNKILGIDLGINNFIKDSENNSIEHPKLLDKYYNKLRKAQQDLAKKQKGSSNRIKAKLRLNKIHEKITNCRNDFLHKISTIYIKKCKIIVIENLNIKKLMQQKNYNAKNIADASWKKFISMLDYKAESANVQVIKINPKNTTKMCSKCRNIQKLSLYKRIYKCNKCGLEIDRDYNSAINILNKFLGSERTFVETKPLLQNEHVLSEKQEAIIQNFKL